MCRKMNAYSPKHQVGPVLASGAIALVFQMTCRLSRLPIFPAWYPSEVPVGSELMTG
jgi:hypothetical protein